MQIAATSFAGNNFPTVSYQGPENSGNQLVKEFEQFLSNAAKPENKIQNFITDGQKIIESQLSKSGNTQSPYHAETRFATADIMKMHLEQLSQYQQLHTLVQSTQKDLFTLKLTTNLIGATTSALNTILRS